MVLKEKAKMMTFIMLAGLLCIALILSTAYSASVKYKINSVLEENNEIVGEIENLKVQINNGKNIKLIEVRATSELGMVYPKPGQAIYIDESETPKKDFALALKERAYN